MAPIPVEDGNQRIESLEELIKCCIISLREVFVLHH